MRWLVPLVLLGCNEPSSTPRDGAPSTDDATADAATPCTALGPCDWLEDYQHRIVSALGGGSEIAPGITLQHRASIGEREYARSFLVDEFTALSLTPTVVPYTFDGRTGGNIIATLPPTDAANASAPAILVGAHFDGVAAGPGAADNATGVAIVLASARFLSTVPRSRPIIFALFDQEELGLIGSKAYTLSLVDAGTSLRGAHLFDMLAWDSDGDRTVELWSPSPALEALYREHGPAHDTPITAVTFSSSDHKAFLDQGFPAVGIGEEFVGGDHTPHYHKATDSVANIQFAHLTTVTRLAFSVLEADAAAP
ncbi:MAG: M28 family metallopeptidase [Kofleriaceae bacterium]